MRSEEVFVSPTAEKIAFRYRDQVVAASGDFLLGGGSGSDNGGSNVWNNEKNSGCYKYSHQKNGAHVCEPK